MKKFDDLLKKGWIMLPIAISFIAGMLDQWVDVPVLYEIMKWSGIVFFIIGAYIVLKTWFLFLWGKE